MTVYVLVGAAGSGKSTWATERFARGEIVSSDALRAAVGTGEADLDASRDAFAVLDVVDDGLDDDDDAAEERSPRSTTHFHSVLRIGHRANWVIVK